MWHNHSFSQRKKITERAVGVGVGCDRKVGVGAKFEKGGGGGGSNIGAKYAIILEQHDKKTR